ncbi:MAG: hypothetical protein BGO26_19235 [Actinobacteria bacterium 69-20]|nr:ABC transporter permease [Actinomycetota bacterium]OJV24689.1 MAG: hypothetical protein BGO26_19235 [Actinobacteria bacterium 69-20]
MFIAIRDLRFARGRFALIGAVIALMTFLVVMLSGLTAGLGSASISAVRDLPVDSIAFAKPAAGQAVSFTGSALPADTVGQLAAVPGVTAAHPLGVATTQLENGDAAAAVTVIGTDPGLLPPLTAGRTPAAGQIAVAGALTKDAHVHVGDTVTLGGTRFTVSATVEDTSFSHMPTVYTSVDTWRQIAHTDTITAVGLTGTPTHDVPGVTVVSKSAAFGAVGGYSAEQGSLNLIRLLLVAVSVLVVGSFFTVWTMQRAGDLAVVRAIGGSRRYLLRDALGQALLIMVLGAGVGAGLAAVLGLLAANVVPFTLSAATLALPMVVMIVAGLVGAAASTRRISTIDPLTALGASR